MKHSGNCPPSIAAFSMEPMEESDQLVEVLDSLPLGSIEFKDTASKLDKFMLIENESMSDISSMEWSLEDQALEEIKRHFGLGPFTDQVDKLPDMEAVDVMSLLEDENLEPKPKPLKARQLEKDEYICFL